MTRPKGDAAGNGSARMSPLTSRTVRCRRPRRIRSRHPQPEVPPEGDIAPPYGPGVLPVVESRVVVPALPPLCDRHNFCHAIEVRLRSGGVSGAMRLIE